MINGKQQWAAWRLTRNAEVMVPVVFLSKKLYHYC